ncbi:hypothetical protein [Actinoplanes sp. M2I2]|uniref:hypothetical protein n=1 Tax=Actinoplanes sp. M2I2 TaxID=1734444 RepID=UPI002021956B|nr:hypothetical protein [Actinoplanes sp. M2I2]
MSRRSARVATWLRARVATWLRARAYAGVTVVPSPDPLRLAVPKAYVVPAEG